GIAAYKSAELVRLLRSSGAIVKVVMSAAAQEFITPLTLQALSGLPVATELLDTESEAAMGHIELARWADCVLIAPATADVISGLAVGSGANLLLTLCLACSCPVAVAPAMNQAMWRHPATQHNVQTLQSRGLKIFGPGEGQQACGDVGPGRMLEPTQIAELLAAMFPKPLLAGLRVMVTAGPTREAIDPVRYLSNHSSGKMGYALAEAAAELGASVVLISGPSRLTVSPSIQCVQVVSAAQMHRAVLDNLQGVDIFIGAAAVADYRPKNVAANKIKKTDASSVTLELEKNPDIIAAVANSAERPFTVGFAAETTNLVEYAKDKLTSKKLDAIIANDVSQFGIGFDADENEVTVFYGDQQQRLAQAKKSVLAIQILELLAHLYSKSTVVN
nr:bifunctional phosphopantothenoylcysteine decarboxylase/phosphopantothenate--cysteine ligase CoaBC [Cellvibrionaceae bacterium]